MKHKTIKHLLLNSLFDVDFFLVKNKAKIISPFKTINFSKQQNISIINPLLIFIALKQFVRVMQFIKQQNNFLINFFVQGLHQKTIINSFISINKLNFNFKIFFKFLILKKQKQYSQFLLTIDKGLQVSNAIFNSLLRENLYLIQEINSLPIKVNMNTYKIYNNLFDYKKLLFILLIINQILKNKIKYAKQ